MRFSSEVLEGFLRKVYEGFDVSSEIEPTAWREVLRLMNEASVEGLVSSGHTLHEESFLRKLKHSNEVFSAFKVHSMGVKMAERLHDKQGKLRPFAEWQESVRGIASHQVGSWLRTEYDTAVLRAHQAADWKEFERNRDILPNLKWMPTTSPSPDTVHEGFWSAGLTLPIDDPFWADNHPANRWNCKCSLEATDEPASDSDWAQDKHPATAQPGLESNPRLAQTFSDKHPYFPKFCATCPFYKDKPRTTNWLKTLLFHNGRRKKDCLGNCPYVDLQIDKVKGYTPPGVDDYIPKYGGELMVSPHHGKGELEENMRLGKRLAKLYNERVYLLPNLKPDNAKEAELRKVLQPKGVKDGKNADFFVKGRTFEGKSMLKLKRGKTEDKYKNDIEQRYKDALSQADNALLEIPRYVPLKAITRAMSNKMSTAAEGTTVVVFYGKRTFIFEKQRSGYTKRGF